MNPKLVALYTSSNHSIACMDALLVPEVIRYPKNLVPKRKEFDEMCLAFAKIFRSRSMLSEAKVSEMKSRQAKLTEFSLAFEICRFFLEGQTVFKTPFSLYSPVCISEIVTRAYFLNFVKKEGIEWIGRSPEILMLIDVCSMAQLEDAFGSLVESAMEILAAK